MKYISDDGKKIGTETEVREYEEALKFDGELAEQVGEYLDAVLINVKDENGKEKLRNLTAREFKRRETVIMGWLQWDRNKRPERYEPEEADEAAVRVVTGAA